MVMVVPRARGVIVIVGMVVVVGMPVIVGVIMGMGMATHR